MYRVAVTERIMIAHSFRGEVFGPAQRLHGATYVIEAAFRRRELDPDGLVVDIGLAHQVLKAVLAPIDYRNLDELEVFAGTNTTTEFLARWVCDRVLERAAAGELGPYHGGLGGLTVTLRESDVAWASYDAELPGA
ncbi:MAG: 6-carboxytetrahydropterin synthase [Alphaproteobacteria bacterium]|nr:6-carboxytetrahydropterin synthase [Alphaproteobacteria bacterium]